MCLQLYMFFFPGVSLNGSYPINKQNFRCQKHPTSFLPSFSPLSRSPHAGSAAPDGEPDVAAKSLGAPPSLGRESAWVRPAAHGELEGFNGKSSRFYHGSFTMGFTMGFTLSNIINLMTLGLEGREPAPKHREMNPLLITRGWLEEL